MAGALGSSFRLAARLSPAVRALPEVVSATRFAERLDAALAASHTPAVSADAAALATQPESLVRTALTAQIESGHHIDGIYIAQDLRARIISHWLPRLKR